MISNRIIETQFKLVPEGRYSEQFKVAAWYWYVQIQPMLLRGFSVVCGVLSVLIIWSECTFQFPVSLSIPSLILAPNTLNAISEVSGI